MQKKTPPATKTATAANAGASVRLRVCRTDGGIGRYSQTDPRRAAMLVQRLASETIFSSGVISIGTHNPMTLLRADDVAWIEVKTALPCPQTAIPDIESAEMLAGKKQFDDLLAQQWPRWIQRPSSATGDLMQSLVELSFRGGAVIHLNVLGRVGKKVNPQHLFAAPVITAVIAGGGALYINPRTLVRARIYHSLKEVHYPDGILVAEADEI